jgi:S-adenosylmethionine-diacylglycerol 3-amino-3-carboxypropyl transferase
MDTRELVAEAVQDDTGRPSQPVLDRLFTLAFRGFVYSQIWEDPEVDVAAMDLADGHRVVTIASGGCNVMNYLAAADCEVTALDLNPAHVALSRLKLAGATRLPDHEAFFRFFGHADERANLRRYRDHLRPHLDAETRAFWDRRDWLGRRRIRLFANNIYRFGLLGRFMHGVQLLARAHGRNPRSILATSDTEERRAVFERVAGPMFANPLVRAMVRMPGSLYGLGIPPAQYRMLAASAGGDMAALLKARLKRLACDFPIEDNYFAWQAFGRSYDREHRRAVPPYLRAAAFERLRERADNARVAQASVTDHLAGRPAASVDRYVLLDAQDWMSPAQLAALWTEIGRTAAPGARVIFRTAGEASPLEPALPAELLADWDYAAEDSADYSRRDRSSIYGAFHLYRRRR